MQQTPAEELKAIREEIDISMRDFADILEIPKPTYQGYESDRRPVPQEIMEKAKAQLQRTRKYWAEMDKRMDEKLKGKYCPNELRGIYL